MFSATCYSYSGGLVYEKRNVPNYYELIETLIENEILYMDLDRICISEESGYWRVVIYEHTFPDDVLDDTMECTTFYPFDEE